MASYGGAIATSAVGGLFGLLATKKNNEMAAEREKIARQENYKYSEMAANNADARTRALYNDLQSPEAMLRQYRQAGLSPSLMFGGSPAGATPTNGAQGQGAQGITPNVFGYDTQQFANTALMAAQIENISAQARKTEAETNTIEGKNERGKAEITSINANITKTIGDLGKIYAETNLINLKQVYQEFENSINMLNLQYEANINEKKIEYFYKQAEYLAYMTRSEKVKAEVGETTQKEAIQLIKNQVENVAAQTLLYAAQEALANSEVKVNDEQIKNLINMVENRNKNTDINRESLEQTINKWALENGLINRGEINVGDLILKRLLGDKNGKDNGDMLGILITLLKFVK